MTRAATLIGLACFVWPLGACPDFDLADAGPVSDSAGVDSDINPIFDAGHEAGAEADAAENDANSADAASASCDVIITFETGKTPSTIIHVATNGHDDSGDGSSNTPYATIQRAAQDLAPGAEIRLHAGVYAGGISINDIAGTADAPIWIGGAPGESKPVIQGLSQAIHFVHVRYLIVHDLEISGGSDNGINCDDGGDMDDPDATRFVIFRDLDIHDVGGTGNQDCLKLSGLDNYFVLDSQFARCGGNLSGSGIDHVGCHSGLIARCYFEQMSGNAVQCKGGSQDIELRWNHIKDGGERGVNMGGSTGFQFFRPPLSTTADNAEARDIRVVANIFEGCTAALAFVGCVDCLAANNTLINPENWFFRILQETTSTSTYNFLPAQNGVFENNLAYFDRSAMASTQINVGPNTAPETFVMRNNLWYAHDNANQSSPSGLPVSELDSIAGIDPTLDDPDNGIFTIPASSPAVGAGHEPAAAVGDFSGTCYAAPPSIGAFASVR